MKNIRSSFHPQSLPCNRLGWNAFSLLRLCLSMVVPLLRIISVHHQKLNINRHARISTRY
nr:MAG TPA: hypothetical protein [Caudoviricetes sp.]